MRQRRNIITGLLALVGCGPTLTETSVEVDITKLRTLMGAIKQKIPQGFTEQHIAEIEKDFRALQVNTTKQYSFPITHDGNTTELNVSIRKEDVDAVEIHFYAPLRLTAVIEETIRNTPLDVTP